MHTKFDRVEKGGCGYTDNKGTCQGFVEYMAKEDKKDLGHAPEWWFDQNGKEMSAIDVMNMIDADWQGLGKKETKFTTGSINPSEREFLAMGSTYKERIKNFKTWVAEKFTTELAGNFNKHKVPTEETWLLKGATPAERVDKYKKEVAAEMLSKYAKSFRFNKPTTVEMQNICSNPNPAEAFRAWMYGNFAGKTAAMAWAHDKKREGEAEWQAEGNKQQRVTALVREALYAFREKFEAKFGGYMAMQSEADRKDVDVFKTWLDKTFSVQLSNDFKLPTKQGEPIIITPENINIAFKLEHNRYYKGDDKEVLEGKAKSGDAKPNSIPHVHFLMATKTADKQNRINPQTNNKKEFDRTAFFQKVEQAFDKHFDYKRSYEESFASKLAVAATQNKVNPLTLGKEAFSDRQAEYGAEHEDLAKSERKGKSL